MPLNVFQYTSSDEIESAISKLPLPALNHHYRLLLTQKLAKESAHMKDVQELARLCISMGIPQAALAVINNLELSKGQLLSNVVNDLNRECYNFSQTSK
ncbi:hypothetical protein K8T06_13465 [bacterium]|nr:hypothetical protein [bacterium]